MSYLDQVKKPTVQAPVLTIVGFPGVGKSSLAALFPSPIFIQAENAESVFEIWEDDKKPSMMPELPSAKRKGNVKPSEVMLDQLRELVMQDHPFKTVVIDAITTANSLFESEAIEFDANPETTNIGEAAGGFGKGYLQVAAQHAKIRSACEHLRRKGITIVFLAHSGIAKVKNRPDVEAYATWSLDMHEASRKVYVATSDAVLYLKSKEFVMGSDKDKKGNIKSYGRVTSTGERVLICASEGTIGYVDAKNRYDLPDEIEVNKGENPLLALIPFYNQEVK